LSFREIAAWPHVRLGGAHEHKLAAVLAGHDLRVRERSLRER